MSQAQITRSLNKSIKESLTKLGFKTFKGRRAYMHCDDFIVGFSTNAVGKYFSEVTGFTPSSFTAFVWIHYSFIPSFEEASESEVFLPKSAHYALDLEVINFKTQKIRECSSKQEQKRKDIWWMELDGSNLDDTIADLTSSIEKNVQPWIEKMSKLGSAIKEVKKTKDCPSKYFNLYHLGKQLGDQAIMATNETKLRDSKLSDWDLNSPMTMRGI